MIYTSYYGNRNIPNNLLKVSISLYPPKHFNGVHYPILAPSKQLLDGYKNGLINKVEYVDIFISELDKKDIKSILNSMLNFECDMVLMCYEKKNDFCHRNILSFYAEYYFGIEIKEL